MSVSLGSASMQAGSWTSTSMAALAQFFFIGDPDGDKIEILQRAGRYL